MHSRMLNQYDGINAAQSTNYGIHWKHCYGSDISSILHMRVGNIKTNRINCLKSPRSHKKSLTCIHDNVILKYQYELPL